jgi:peptide/nickel transport system permease protein
MVVFLLRRALTTVVVLWLVLTATFFVMRASPGQPAALYASPNIPPTQQRALSRALGLDQSPGRQYFTWLSATLRGNLGISLNQGRPVGSLMAAHLLPSLLLGAVSITLAIGIGLPTGIFTSHRAGSSSDLLLRTISLTLYSLPTFWLGLMAILLFSYLLPLFPPGHLQSIGTRDSALTARIIDLLYHLVLPASVLGASMAPSIAQLVRRSLLETLSREFIAAARARGLSELRILLVHSLPLALAPVIQVVGLSLPLLVSGVLVTEVVFSWPGMGRLTHVAMITRDYPVVLGATALATVSVSVGSLVADLIHAAVDPRARSLSHR